MDGIGHLRTSSHNPRRAYPRSEGIIPGILIAELRSKLESLDHHNFYVVLLDPRLEVHIDWQGQPQLVGRLHAADRSAAVSFEYAPAFGVL